MTLFNDISIERMAADGTVDSIIKVPITFSDKSKWYRKLREEVSKNPKGVSRLLPRMGADLVGMRPDASRRGISTTKHVHEYTVTDSSSSSSTSRTARNVSYRRVPFTYEFELSIATKTMTDSLAIIEQILPFFKPDLTVTINDMTSLDIKTDIPVVLTAVTKESTRLDAFDVLDVITWTLSFELRGYMYPPINKTGVILDSLVNLYDMMPDESPSKVADIRSETVPGVEYDINDPDTYNTTITEYVYASSSSSSSGA